MSKRRIVARDNADAGAGTGAEVKAVANVPVVTPPIDAPVVFSRSPSAVSPDVSPDDALALHWDAIHTSTLAARQAEFDGFEAAEQYGKLVVSLIPPQVIAQMVRIAVASGKLQPWTVHKLAQCSLSAVKLGSSCADPTSKFASLPIVKIHLPRSFPIPTLFCRPRIRDPDFVASQKN
jgi:hypothetical protein